MRIGAEIEWRKNCFGHVAHALYLGNLYVGEIMPGSPGYHSGEWRGWFNNDDEGNETGWFTTAEQARDSVEKALFGAIKLEDLRHD